MKERTAKKGKWLTNATVENEAERIFVKKVAGYGDLDNLFRDATQEEKDKWEAEHPAEEVNE